MRYPSFWRKMCNATAYFSGIITFIIAILSASEVVTRDLLQRPTSWNLNVCEYMLIWCLFIGSAYAFQSHGHVAVDLFRNWIDKKVKSKNRLPRRIMAVFGLFLCILYVGTLLLGTLQLFEKGLKYGRVTNMNPEIPTWILYAPMLIGEIMMILTLVFMILDAMKGGDEFL